ncbi:MAG: hypothetical protein MZV63_65295 [Marinilabiliales bacterium]|nr:hypothetical protein [Marinilabiliales bacterium]
MLLDSLPHRESPSRRGKMIVLGRETVKEAGGGGRLLDDLGPFDDHALDGHDALVDDALVVADELELVVVAGVRQGDIEAERLAFDGMDLLGRLAGRGAEKLAVLLAEGHEQDLALGREFVIADDLGDELLHIDGLVLGRGRRGGLGGQRQGQSGQAGQGQDGRDQLAERICHAGLLRDGTSPSDIYGCPDR